MSGALALSGPGVQVLALLAVEEADAALRRAVGPGRVVVDGDNDAVAENAAGLHVLAEPLEADAGVVGVLVAVAAAA